MFRDVRGRTVSAVVDAISTSLGPLVVPAPLQRLVARDQTYGEVVMSRSVPRVSSLPRQQSHSLAVDAPSGAEVMNRDTDQAGSSRDWRFSYLEPPVPVAYFVFFSVGSAVSARSLSYPCRCFLAARTYM